MSVNRYYRAKTSEHTPKIQVIFECYKCSWTNIWTPILWTFQNSSPWNMLSRREEISDSAETIKTGLNERKMVTRSNRFTIVPFTKRLFWVQIDVDNKPSVTKGSFLDGLIICFPSQFKSLKILACSKWRFTMSQKMSADTLSLQLVDNSCTINQIMATN